MLKLLAGKPSTFRIAGKIYFAECPLDFFCDFLTLQLSLSTQSSLPCSGGLTCQQTTLGREIAQVKILSQATQPLATYDPFSYSIYGGDWLW